MVVTSTCFIVCMRMRTNNYGVHAMYAFSFGLYIRFRGWCSGPAEKLKGVAKLGDLGSLEKAVTFFFQIFYTKSANNQGNEPWKKKLGR